MDFLFLSWCLVLADTVFAHGNPDIFVYNTTNSSVTFAWRPESVSQHNFGLTVYKKPHFKVFSQEVLPSTHANIKLANLNSGEKYLYRMCRKDSQTGTDSYCFGEWTSFTTKPNPPENITVTALFEKEMKIHWQPPSIPCVFEKYRATIGSLKSFELMGYTQATFSNLISGKLYEVRVQSVSSDSALSEPLVIQLRTKPMPPSLLSLEMVRNISSLNIHITWTDPPGDCEFDGFQIIVHRRFHDPLRDFDFTSSATFTSDQHFFVYGHVTQCHVYRVFALSLSGNVSSRPLYQDIVVGDKLCL